MSDPSLSSGTAFGLAIEADFPVPGLCPGAPDELPTTVLQLADDAQLERVWRDGEAAAMRISEERVGDDVHRSIDAHPELGYRLHARYFGSCLVALDGGRMLCVPPPVASWRWQRFLVGRCLPLAAVLRGYEVLHAGAAVVDDGVVAIIGPRGAGKSSLTLHLVLQGAGFFTDDVLAVELDGDDVLAHPGFGVVNVRDAEHERITAQQRAALGELLGQTGRDKRHYALETAAGPRPLRAVYFLVPGTAPAATMAALDAPEPLRLLTSTFIKEIRPPGRLQAMLHLCARLAERVPMFEIERGEDETAEQLAARLRAHVEAEVLV